MIQKYSIHACSSLFFLVLLLFFLNLDITKNMIDTLFLNVFLVFVLPVLPYCVFLKFCNMMMYGGRGIPKKQKTDFLKNGKNRKNRKNKIVKKRAKRCICACF